MLTITKLLQVSGTSINRN